MSYLSREPSRYVRFPGQKPKVRLARQLGIALTPKAAKVMENQPNPWEQIPVQWEASLVIVFYSR